jgi:hypothetical protein
MLAETISIKKAHPYLVIWEDACGQKEGTPPWVSPKELTTAMLAHNICYSVGWLVGQVGHYIVLAGSFGATTPTLDEIDDLGRFESIPIGWILSMVSLPYRLPKKVQKLIKAAKKEGQTL